MINSDALSAPLQPFEKIGVCFSGGGYRATAFSLGVLAYLNRISLDNKPLLEKVIAVSSVSGGTITAATFAASQSRGDSFDTFYTKLYSFLKEDKLVDEATAKFMDNEIWKTTTRSRSIINGFALTYFERLVGESFDVLNPLNIKGHLKYVSFNATEFTFGLAFRFQNVNKFGNYQLNCKQLEEVKGDLRIADAIASSSCFPGGFDPMIFPNDYIEDHNSQAYLNLVKVDNFKNGVGIMDGGIVDNQGIGSMVNFDKSSQEGFPLDLLIVNDVDGFVMTPWVPYDSSGKHTKNESLASFIAGWLGNVQMKPIYWIGLLFGVIGTIVFYKMNCPVASLLSAIVIGAFSILTALGLFGDKLVKKLKAKALDKFQAIVPHSLLTDIEKFAQLEVSLVEKMVKNRFSSAMLMINEIFLRQIRRMNFNLFYASPRFLNRRITSMVYQLNGQQNTLGDGKQKEKAEKIKISDLIQKSALIASKMPTTLWWDAKDLEVQRQENLIACGQFTTCYNLIKYIQDLPQEYHTERIKNLEKALLEDWSKFEQNPLVFVVEG